MLGIIDYGMGNLRSVQKAFEFLGHEAIISDDAAILYEADKIILPGVGAFADAIAALREKKLDILLQTIVKEQKPLLGICLGMQLLFDKSYEYGEHEGLGILEGKILKLPSDVKVPHMGWNSLDVKKEAPLFEGLSKEPYVYFVHSYYLETDAPIVSATTYYGKEISVAAQQDNVFALQFHPEKSGDIGLKILHNFGRIL
ncbi:MAG: imidazole glycerol phosphate synthase subunit HisH [Epulopiscium sp.]|nr:imidazole glycerol phosphate synthase subunit HisH [Candidatus Epulonipiscium sp.]